MNLRRAGIVRSPRWLAGWAMAAALVLAGPTAGMDPDSDTVLILDSEGGSIKRTDALERLWAAVEAGTVDRAAARETLKQVLWKGSAPPPLRQAALAKLLTDASPEGQADNRKFLRLRLPTESQWPVIDAICKEVTVRAGDPAWRELAPALVRSYARKVPVPPDPDRPERPALLALFPGQSIEQAVFGVYLRPQDEAELPGQSPEIVEKQREAAWELLGRLDPDGSRRREMLAGVSADDEAVKPLARAASELRVVPVTGSELAWLKGLLNSTDPAAADWWTAAQAAVQRLSAEQSRGLQLRHIEPVRWAAAHRAEWLSSDAQSLGDELERRLEPRRKWKKTEGLGAGEPMSREALADWRAALAWGDLLSILVIDEALKDERIAGSLFKQADADRNDTSAEYGGVVFAADAVPMVAAAGKVKPRWDVDPAAAGGGGFVVRGFSPRPAQRVNDRTFVAPEDMFTVEGAGGRALAHYHFHAQGLNNADYAGPGRGDFDYADTHGRACLVITSVRPGVLNVDYYQRTAPGTLPRGATGAASGGIQIDLGELRSGRE